MKKARRANAGPSIGGKVSKLPDDQDNSCEVDAQVPLLSSPRSTVPPAVQARVNAAIDALSDLLGSDEDQAAPDPAPAPPEAQTVLVVEQPAERRLETTKQWVAELRAQQEARRRAGAEQSALAQACDQIDAHRAGPGREQRNQWERDRRAREIRETEGREVRAYLRGLSENERADRRKKQKAACEQQRRDKIAADPSRRAAAREKDRLRKLAKREADREAKRAAEAIADAERAKLAIF